jgi:hypothetical protein
MKLTFWAVLGMALLVAACEGPADPSDPLAPPTTTESFTGTLAVGGFRFYSFVVGARGTVNVTINSLTAGGAAYGSTVALSIGQPSGTGCADLSASTVGTGSPAPQLTGAFNPGTLCVRVADNGNLTELTAFDISIAHP